MHLYELALAEGETSRDLMARARRLGMGKLTATTVLSEDQACRLCPQRVARAGVAAGAGPGGAGAAPGAGGGAATRSGPSMGFVAATIVGALAVLSVGIAVLGDGSAAAEGRATTATEEGVGDDRADVADVGAADEPFGDGALPPVDATLTVVDVQRLCAGWPAVADHWAELNVVIAAATDPEKVASWAAQHQSGAEMALRDQLAHAFDEAGRATVLAVLDWVYEVAFPSRPVEVVDVRRATDEIAPYVAALRGAAGTRC